MIACFDADWAHEDFTPHPESTLIWCPDNGRQRVADFIDAAKHSLWVQNERYQDTVIIERLVRAATRGVKVHVLTKQPHSLKPDKLIEGIGGLRILQDVGVKVHTMKHLKLHAKMMLADEQTRHRRFDQPRAGQLRCPARTRDRNRPSPRREAARRDRAADWEASHKIDLSDEGLLADLKKRDLDASQLAIGGDKKKHKSKD